MNYGEILQRSFELLRRVRTLLILGFIMALVGGGAGVPNFNFGVGNTFEEMPQDIPMPPFPRMRFDEFLPFLLLFIAFVVVLALIGIVVRYIATAGLIDAAARAAADTPVSVGDALRRGASRRAFNLFLADLVVYLPLGIIAAFLLFIVAAPLVFGIFGAAQDRPGLALGGIGGFFLLLLPLLALFALVGVVVTLLLQWTHRAVVLGDRGPLAGLRLGWRTLRTNPLESFVLWVIQLVLSVAAAVASFIVTLIVLVPAVAFFVALGMTIQAWLPLVLLGIPVVLFLWIAASLVQGIVVAYIETYWTLAWLELRGEPVVEAA